nr:zinc finger BED domain-containing protein RICESLEEPER 2-like [Ipomoea batatas]
MDLKSYPYSDFSKIDMQDMLSEFFDKIHAGRSVLCAGLVPKRMQMPWRDFKNKSDYGDCGLVKGDYSMLRKLRLQYIKELTVSEFNLHRSRNLAWAYPSIKAPLSTL